MRKLIQSLPSEDLHPGVLKEMECRGLSFAKYLILLSTRYFKNSNSFNIILSTTLEGRYYYSLKLRDVK